MNCQLRILNPWLSEPEPKDLPPATHVVKLNINVKITFYLWLQFQKICILASNVKSSMSIYLLINYVSRPVLPIFYHWSMTYPHHVKLSNLQSFIHYLRRVRRTLPPFDSISPYSCHSIPSIWELSIAPTYRYVLVTNAREPYGQVLQVSCQTKLRPLRLRIGVKSVSV